MKNFFKQEKWRILITLIYTISVVGILGVLFGYVSAWWLLGAYVWSKIIQTIGHTIGLHRYFSHHSFDTTRTWEKIMAYTSILMGIGSPIQYARNHRFHHRKVDTSDDIHSPLNDGKLFTAFGLWAFHDVNWFMKKGTESVRDLMNNPMLRVINNWYYPIWYTLIALTLLINWKITVYCLMLPSFIFHVEMNTGVNMACHIWGYQNYKGKDDSKNNKWVSMWLQGEGFHNNHHAKPHLYDCAVKKDEFDFCGWFIDKFMAVDGKHTKAGKIRID